MSQGPPEPASPEDLVQVGRIVRPHGLRGDVVVELITDRDERLAPGSRLVAEPGQPGAREAAPESRTLVVRSASRQRPAGSRRRARWTVRFEGSADVQSAEAWRGAVLWAEPLDDPDTLWVDDLVGAEVVLTGGTRVGTCVAVVANPAADLLELDTGALIPVTFVVDGDDGDDGGRVVVDPPDGLLDL